MSRLILTFDGVCSHFRGVVPGIPHRVVLPDASAFRFGMIDVPLASGEFMKSVNYFLMPHFAILRTDPALQERLTIQSVMEQGNVYDGIRLQIANAVGDTVNYDESFNTGVHAITEFVSDYMWSADVVLGGRAVCYADLSSAESVAKGAAGDDHQVGVRATILTDGPPELLVTPFSPLVKPVRIPLDNGQEEVHLLVANRGIDCHKSRENNFDFLLHYLTAAKGIPRVLRKKTPGLKNDDVKPITERTYAEALAELATLDFPNHFLGPCFGPEAAGVLHETSAACSDTRYP